MPISLLPYWIDFTYQKIVYGYNKIIALAYLESFIVVGFAVMTGLSCNIEVAVTSIVCISVR